MRYVNKYLRNLAPYRVASHKIWDVSPEERKEILKLDWNEATINPSPLVHLHISEYIRNMPNYNYYPSTYSEELHFLFSRYSEVPISNLQYFASSDVLHEYIAKVFISIGDPVLILGPTYDNFRLTCEAQGGKVSFSEFSNEFTISEEIFENDILRTNPSLVYICNPNNPTGNLLSVGFIEKLLKKFTETLFIVDEAYYEFTGVTAKDLIFKYENLLITRTMSKAFALASFRIGYLLSCAENINTISKVRNPKNFTTFAQIAAIAALNDIKYVKDYVLEVELAKKQFLSFLGSINHLIKFYNTHGNFLLLRLSSFEEKKKMISYLEENNIFVRDFSHNRSIEDCFRITIGTRKQMKRVENVIGNYLNLNDPKTSHL